MRRSFDLVLWVSDGIVQDLSIDSVGKGIDVSFVIEVLQLGHFLVVLQELEDILLQFLVLQKEGFHLRNSVPLFAPVRPDDY